MTNKQMTRYITPERVLHNTANKTMIAVVDTEMLGKLGGDEFNRKVFDIGFQIVDKKGTVYSSGSFLPQEFWDEIDNLKPSSFLRSKKKRLEYDAKVESGETDVLPWDRIMALMKHEMACYDVDYFAAYNLNHDKGVLQKTHELLSPDTPFDLMSAAKPLDIYPMAVQLLLNRPTYKRLALKHGRVSKNGTPSATAESAYAYITGNWDYKEIHTGFQDVLIEVEILAYCYRQNKAFNGNINPQAHRIFKDERQTNEQLSLAL